MCRPSKLQKSWPTRQRRRWTDDIAEWTGMKINGVDARSPVTLPQRQFARPTRPRWGVATRLTSFPTCSTETFAGSIAAYSVESLVLIDSHQKFGW